MFEHERMIAAGAVNSAKKAVGIVSRPIAVTYNKNRVREHHLKMDRPRSPEELKKILAADLKRQKRADKKLNAAKRREEK